MPYLGLSLWLLKTRRSTGELCELTHSHPRVFYGTPAPARPYLSASGYAVSRIRCILFAWLAICYYQALTHIPHVSVEIDCSILRDNAYGAIFRHALGSPSPVGSINNWGEYWLLHPRWYLSHYFSRQINQLVVGLFWRYRNTSMFQGSPDPS